MSDVMIARCGHEITEDDIVKAQILKNWTLEGAPCLQWIVVCAACRQKNEDAGIVLHNREEQIQWAFGDG